VAQLNFSRVVFKWFDYVLKGKDKPEQLKDKVNYPVMGTNDWRHSASLETMANKLLKSRHSYSYSK